MKRFKIGSWVKVKKSLSIDSSSFLFDGLVGQVEAYTKDVAQPKYLGFARFYPYEVKFSKKILSDEQKEKLLNLNEKFCSYFFKSNEIYIYYPIVKCFLKSKRDIK